VKKVSYNEGMTIYIEIFLLQNIIINFCLLRLVYITLKSKTSFFRLILGTILGALFSVISAMFLTNQTIMNILKFVCALLMLLIAFKQSKKQFIISIILLFLYTYALGGAMTAISSQQHYTTFGVITYSKINLNIVCLGIIILTYIFELVAKNMKLRFKSNSFIYKATLKYKDKSLSINAYMDTGNLLNIDGNPVIIVDLEVYLTLTNTTIIDFYLRKNPEITTSTITGHNNLKLFIIDELQIKTDKKFITINNQYIAVNTCANFKDTNYQALLSPMIL